jgi:acetyltransferase-like isoleucine patch superfamily enzyme
VFVTNSLPRRIWNRLLRVPYRILFRPYYRHVFRAYGENIGWGRRYEPLIPANVKIACPENITIGDNCKFDEYTHLLATPSSRLVIGNNVRFANGYAHVVASFDEIVVEDDCLFAAFVQVINGNHGYGDVTRPIKDQESFSTGPIRIGRGSWLGRGACVLGGVTLGRNVVVGANAVVTRSVPDYCVVAGIPAVIIRQYNPNTCRWERPPGAESARGRSSHVP